MQLLSLIFASLLVGIGAMPAVSRDQKPKPKLVAEWTLSRASRVRNSDKSLCNWQLTIHDEASRQPPQTCAFDVRGDNATSCDHVQFANISCSAESDWVMNGGWSDYEDFVVMVVSNVRENAMAYFGFASSALDGGQPIPKQIESARSTEIRPDIE